jgi:hypothetical protein
MTNPTEMTWGSYNAEVPKLYFTNRNGDKRVLLDPEFILNLTLQESIDQFCIYGKLTIMDNGNGRMKNIFSEGLEYIEAELKGLRNEGGQYGGDPGKPLRFEILNLTSEKVGKVVMGAFDKITFSIAQFPAYRNLLVWNISKGWKDKKIHEIVVDIFQFLNKDLNLYTYKLGETIEETETTLESYCSPFWSPAKNLNYLKKYATSSSLFPGYYTYFDMTNQFHFRSFEHIFVFGEIIEIDLVDVITTNIKDAVKDTKKFVKDYFPDLAHKEYYKLGLSGSSAERFNWFKKKQYTYKKGYKKRSSPQINNLYEKEDEINNMFGNHQWCGYRNEKDTQICSALADNLVMTAVGAQSQAQIVVNGITNPVRVKSGDAIVVLNKVQGINENVEELAGSWTVRGIVHVWSNDDVIYRQYLDLCREYSFEH